METDRNAEGQIVAIRETVSSSIYSRPYEDVITRLETRLESLEAWVRGYASPLLQRSLNMGEMLEINKGKFESQLGSDMPDLNLRELK